MHRVLSGQASRCMESSQEFITKKLCISAVFICAFFSVLGGFLMGRYAYERFHSKHQPTAVNQQYSNNLNQLSISINKLGNLTKIISSGNFSINLKSEINYKLQCDKSNLTAPNYLSNDINLLINEIINIQLLVLKTCYDNLSDFLESIVNSN